MDERAMRFAEETRLRDEAQKWAQLTKEAQDAALPEAEELDEQRKRAVRAYEAFQSGFDNGEGE